MTDPFDIFEVDAGNAVRWLGAAATLAETYAQIQRQEAWTSGRYVVVDQKTGERLTVERSSSGLISRAADIDGTVKNQSSRRTATA